MFFKLWLKKKSNSKQLDLKTINKRTAFWKPLVILIPTFIVLLLFTIIPFIITSRQSVSEAVRHHPDQVNIGLNNFREIFADKNFHTALYNSFLYALIALPVGLGISILISGAISQVMSKKIRSFFQTIFFLPYVTSAIAIAIAFAYLFDQDTGILNKIIGHNVPWLKDPDGHHALGAMLMYGVWRSLAFNILILTTAMLGVDKNRYKAASIDGAGKVRQFISITLPSIRGTINFLITVGLIGALKVFPLALFQNNSTDAMSNGGSTLMLYIFDKIQNGGNKIGQAAAASIILLVVAIGFNVAVKSVIRITTWGFRKVGEINVSRKIDDFKLSR